MTKKNQNQQAEDPYVRIGVLEAMVQHFYKVSDRFTADPAEIYGKTFWKDVNAMVKTISPLQDGKQ